MVIDYMDIKISQLKTKYIIPRLKFNIKFILPAITITITLSSLLFLFNTTYAGTGYSVRAHGEIIKCKGACPVYPDKPSFMIGTNNALCYNYSNQKGGAWVLSSNKTPQEAKCTYAGEYVEPNNYIYCQFDNCNATIMGHIINVKGKQGGFPFESYRLKYNFSLFCRSSNWEQISSSVFLCKNNK